MSTRSILTGLVLLALTSVGGFLLLTKSNNLTREVPVAGMTPRSANLSNGETMFNIGGCASCHATPKADAKPEDRLLLGGGLELPTPFGTFKVPNISPNPANGIGAWTEYDFANAMQRGVGRNGEHLYPAFPYASYQRMQPADVADLYAYLRTLPPVATPSEPHRLSFPYNVRRGLGLWKLLHLDGKTFQADVSKSAAYNRGAYLVEGPAHCAECHSPRDISGGIVSERRFAGGPDAEGKDFVPNITQHEDGIKKYSEKDIAYLLETGFTPDNDNVGSSMADVVQNTSKLTHEDRAAMAAYIKSLPARPGKPPKKH